jgi:hypothetical protein
MAIAQQNESGNTSLEGLARDDEIARAINALRDEITSSTNLPETVKSALLSLLDSHGVRRIRPEGIKNLIAEVERALQGQKAIHEVRAIQAAVVDAAYVEEAIAQNNEITKQWFADDIDTDVLETISILSLDHDFNLANESAKSADDVGANMGAGIIRAWDALHVDAEERRQMLAALKRFGESNALSLEHQQTLLQLRILLEDGHVSQETFEMAMRGKLFNNMGDLQKRVSIDGQARAMEFRAVEALMPAAQREAIIAAAQKQGIPTDGQRLLDVVDALRLRAPNDSSLEPLRRTAEAVRGGAVYSSAMDLLMQPQNERIRKDFFAGDGEERFDILARIYREANGRPMPQHVQHVVSLMVDTLQTPEQVRGYLDAAKQSAMDGNLNAVSNYMGNQIALRLNERAQSGDENAAKDFRNMKNLGVHIAAIRAIDPALAPLADRIEVQLRQISFRGVQQDGRVPYDAMQAAIATELDAYTRSGGQANPQAVERLRDLREQIGNRGGIQAPGSPEPPRQHTDLRTIGAALAQSGVATAGVEAASVPTGTPLALAGVTGGQHITDGTHLPAHAAGIPRAPAMAIV